MDNLSARDIVYDIAAQSLRLLEAADDLVDDAEEERKAVYAETADNEHRRAALEWIERVQALRDGLVEHSAALRSLHASMRPAPATVAV